VDIPRIVNSKTNSCTANNNFDNLSINDLLENIRLLLDYILSQKMNKVKRKSINSRGGKDHFFIEEIIGNLAIYLNPKYLFKEYRKQLDTTKINKFNLQKYWDLLSNIQYAWQKILKYKLYFKEFYPSSNKIEKFEALNHHIQAYLQDMTIFKNKIEVFLGVLKNDTKKMATNKVEVVDFFKAKIQKTKEVFESVSKYRDPHTHKGKRFLDGDLLKAENDYNAIAIFQNFFTTTLNPKYKVEFIKKLKKRKEESFESAKLRWVKMARKNDEQTSGYLNMLLKGIRPSLYQFLKIKSVKETIDLFKK